MHRLERKVRVGARVPTRTHGKARHSHARASVVQANVEGGLQSTPSAIYWLYLGVADGMSIAWVWTCLYSKMTLRRSFESPHVRTYPRNEGVTFEYQHVHTRAIDMPSRRRDKLI